jgi:hypothetical protein
MAVISQSDAVARWFPLVWMHLRPNYIDLVIVNCTHSQTTSGVFFLIEMISGLYKLSALVCICTSKIILF